MWILAVVKKTPKNPQNADFFDASVEKSVENVEKLPKIRLWKTFFEPL